MYIGIEEIRKAHGEDLVLTQKEKDLILMIRYKVEFGDIEIEIKNGEPVFLKQISIRTLLGQ